MNTKTRKTLDLGIYLLFTLILIFTISQKTNYHIDEFFSYNLANHDGVSSLHVEDGIKYDNYKELFNEYSTVDSNNRFSLSTVWNNQAADVHPPFFYIFLNLLSSFTPGVFSKWYPGIINIIGALIVLFFSQKIVKLLTDDKTIYYCISLIIILSSGIIDDVAFYRMYILSMMWVTISTYLFLSQIKNDKGIGFYIPVILVTYLGAMTHYYCIVYSFFISAVYGIYLLFKKDYKGVLYFCISMAIAGLLSYITFPPMINHIFSGYRGQEATSNFFDLSDYITRFIIFFKIINNEIFGESLVYILAIIILLFLCILFNKKRNIINIDYIIVLLPSALYFIIVSKVAAYLNERYISHIYAVLLVGVFTLLFTEIKTIISKKTFVLIITLSVIFIFSGLYNAKWTYLYKDTKVLVDYSINNADKNCICIHGDTPHDILYSSMELRNYKSILFVNENDLNNLDVKVDDEIVVKLIKVKNESTIINTLIEKYNFSSIELIGNTRGSTYLVK